MKKIAIAMAAASALLLTTGAHAQAKGSPWYGEVGYSGLTISALGVDLKPAALRGVVGYGFHPNFAVEGMLAFGVKSDSGLKVKHAYGMYLKPRANLTPELEVFGRLGYADTKLSAGGMSDSDSDLSYGAGLSYKVSPALSLGLDYMSYYNKDGAKATGWTLGVGFSF